MRLRLPSVIWFPVVALVIAAPLCASGASGRYEREISAYREFVTAQMEREGIPGMTVGFLKDDFVWVEGFGYADLENKVPAKPESAYRLASVTKPMTAIGVLKLVEGGNLDLDVEIQKYVSYFPEKEWPVTVRAVLGHLSGISHYKNYDEEGHFKHHKNTRQAIAVFADFALVAQPWTLYHYSSYGYNLLGAVIEETSGKSYGDFVRENLWEPLGMSDTRMDSPDAIIPNRARGYRKGTNGETLNSEFVDISSRFAAGGTRSTVVDLLKFARGIMDGRVLSPAYVDTMFTSMSTSDGRYTGYGMGWFIGPKNGRFGVWHSGGQPETRTFLGLFPKERFAIALGYNLEGGNRAPFVDRLYQLIMNEALIPAVYTGDREDHQIITAMAAAFDYGLAEYDRYGEPRCRDPKVLRRAFEYFDSCVKSGALMGNFDETKKKIEEGRHPASNDAFVTVGSYVAATLHAEFGDDYLETLHGGGPIQFFSDYIAWYRDDRRYPNEYRFDRQFEKTVMRWNKDWQKTWTPAVQELAFDPVSDIEENARQLKETFLGTKIYPDFCHCFSEVTESRYAEGDLEGASKVVQAAIELYPRADAAHVWAGVVEIAKGRRDAAFSHLRSAAQFDITDAAGAENLNAIAYRLKSLGQVDAGLDLLLIALQLHPDVANLYDSAGEFYLEKGDEDRAVAYYETALKIDPEFENAKRMLEKIQH
ncbi:MAG: serine hydrolase [Candidatus Latescibacterota bacterium]|nr:MAG: serine hydrolase [Candidatus Latescibacterota bacterium]